MAYITEVHGTIQATRSEAPIHYTNYRVHWDAFGRHETMDCKTLDDAKWFCAEYKLPMNPSLSTYEEASHV